MNPYKPGSRRYRDFERSGSAERARQRDIRYRERKRTEARLLRVSQRQLTVERRIQRQRERAIGAPHERPLEKSRRYIRQRAAEYQTALAMEADPLHDVMVAEREQQMRLPGSTFSRLWAAAEREGFDPEGDSAYRALLEYAGMTGGDKWDPEKYAAVIKWHMTEGRGLPYGSLHTSFLGGIANRV